MTEIPEDVMKAAREAYLAVSTTPTDAWFVKSVRKGDYDHQMPIKASARAILAERERCATIADMEEAAFCEPSIRDSHRSRGARDASIHIAAAIRGGSNA